VVWSGRVFVYLSIDTSLYLARLAVSKKKMASLVVAESQSQGETKTTNTTPPANNSDQIPSDLDNIQQEKIAALRELMGKRLPINGRRDIHMHRFLVARDWVLKDAEVMLANHLAWRTERFPVYRSVWKMDQMFLNGAIFPCGYDREGRPVLVIRSGKFCPSIRNLEDCLAMGVAQVVQLFQNNGGFTKMTIVYDRQDFSMSENLDKPLLKALASLFSDNYPETLHAALVYPCGFLLRGIWAVVQYFFDYKTRQKIHFLGSSDALQEHIDEDQLIKAVGGTHPYTYDYDTFVESYGKVCYDVWQPEPTADDQLKAEGECAAVEKRKKEEAAAAAAGGGF
jgi:hypothetical protein